MTLRQAVETAIRQNPDIALARLEEEKARQAVRRGARPVRAAHHGRQRTRLQQRIPHEHRRLGAQHRAGARLAVHLQPPAELHRGAGQGGCARRIAGGQQQARRGGLPGGVAVPGCRARRPHRRPGAQGGREPGESPRDGPCAGARRPRPAAGGKDGRLPGGARAPDRGRTGGRPGHSGDGAGYRPRFFGRGPRPSGRGAAARADVAAVARRGHPGGHRVQHGAAAPGIADRLQGAGAARRKGRPPAARGPGGAIRTIRQVQQLCGLLPQVPAE